MLLRAVEENSIKPAHIPKSIRKYCLLKEISNTEHTDIEFEKQRFDLEKVYDAYKNNDFVNYNPHKKRIFKKK